MNDDKEQLVVVLDLDQFEHLRYLREKENNGLGWTEDGTDPSNQSFAEYTFKLKALLGNDVIIQSEEVFGGWIIQGTHQQIVVAKNAIAADKDAVFILPPNESLS